MPALERVVLLVCLAVILACVWGAGLAAGGVGEGLVVPPSWLRAEPLDVVVLLWAAGLGGLVLADGLRVVVARWWRGRHAEESPKEGCTIVTTNGLARALQHVFAWWRGDLSPRWRRAQARREARIDFHGVPWRWPVNTGDHDREAA